MQQCGLFPGAHEHSYLEVWDHMLQVKLCKTRVMIQLLLGQLGAATWELNNTALWLDPSVLVDLQYVWVMRRYAGCMVYHMPCKTST
jgi:hypothetical protein